MSDPSTPPSSRSAPPVADLGPSPANGSQTQGEVANRVLIPASRNAPERPPGNRILRLEGQAMGTVWTARIVDDDDGRTEFFRTLIEDELARMTALFSPWECNSEISRFNAAPPGTWALSEPFWTVLSRAMDFGDETAGAVDPTLGALVDLWGFGPPGPRTPLLPVPNDSEIAAALEHCGWMKLRLNPDARAAVQPGGLRLDLSGIAKGHAVDRVSLLLGRAGATAHLFEIGGEFKGMGIRPDSRPWWVELEAPEGLQGPRTLVALHDLAVATSGVARRHFRHLDRTYSHTLDGRTGSPVDNGVASVSVFHDSAMVADAMATALTVMGLRDALDYAEATRLAALIVHRDARGWGEYLTPACQAMLETGT